MATSTVENLHLKVLYNISTSDVSTGNYILARHRPVPVSTFNENVGDSGEKKYATAPLKSCLNAICVSSPELLSDPARDHSIYVLDPLEPLPVPLSSDGPSSSTHQGVSVGMGLLKSFMHQSWEAINDGVDSGGEVSVTGRVIFDRAVNCEVVEIIMTLRENRQSHFVQQSSYYSMYSHHQGVGITAYGSSPAHVAPIMTVNPSRRQQASERRIRNAGNKSSTPAPSAGATSAENIAGSAQQPIVLDGGNGTSETPATPQIKKYDDDTLREIATLLAQVDDPVQQATIMTLLTAGVVPGASTSATDSSMSAFSLIRSLSASLKKVPTPKRVGTVGRAPLKTVTLPTIPSGANTLKSPSAKNKKDMAEVPPLPPLKSSLTSKRGFVDLVPSSDPVVPPSSPTLAVRELAESYRQRGAARCAAPDSRPVLPQQIGSMSSVYPKVTGSSHPKFDSNMNTNNTNAARPSIASNLALPGNQHGKQRSDSNPLPHSKGKKQDTPDENTDPSPKVTQEKKRRRDDSVSEQAPSAKKGRSALTESVPKSPEPVRPLTPPISSLERDTLFTPNAVSPPKTPRRNKPLSHIEASLFTPTPVTTPSRRISGNLASLRNGKTLFPSNSSPGVGNGPGFFSPFVPNPRSGALVEFGMPSGSSPSFFEDSNVNLGWMDFDESDQQRLALNRSSDPAEIADASATIAAANSSRWLGLPPSSPPPPLSPLQPVSSDFDFMNVDSFIADVPSSQLALDDSTPDGELGADIASDAVDPFEFFTSLGLTFPQDLDENNSIDDSGLQDQNDPHSISKGMRELISGCVL